MGGAQGSARCVWTEMDEMTIERDGSEPCDVVSRSIKAQIKLDLFGKEADLKAYVPVDMAKAAMLFSGKTANLASLDLQVLVSGDGRSRKWGSASLASANAPNAPKVQAHGQESPAYAPLER